MLADKPICRYEGQWKMGMWEGEGRLVEAAGVVSAPNDSTSPKMF